MYTFIESSLPPEERPPHDLPKLDMTMAEALSAIPTAVKVMPDGSTKPIHESISADVSNELGSVAAGSMFTNPDGRSAAATRRQQEADVAFLRRQIR